MSRLTPESIRASQAELPPIGTVITELRRQVPTIQQEQHRYSSPRGFQPWANHLAYAALIEAGAQQIGEHNPTVEDLSHPAWQWWTLEDMESENYESSQGSVRPKASI
jgi:hypothetical protein